MLDYQIKSDFATGLLLFYENNHFFIKINELFPKIDPKTQFFLKKTKCPSLIHGFRESKKNT